MKNLKSELKTLFSVFWLNSTLAIHHACYTSTSSPFILIFYYCITRYHTLINLIQHPFITSLICRCVLCLWYHKAKVNWSARLHFNLGAHCGYWQNLFLTVRRMRSRFPRWPPESTCIHFSKCHSSLTK